MFFPEVIHIKIIQINLIFICYFKKLIMKNLIVILIIFLNSCVGYESLRGANRVNITKIKIGDPLSAVTSIMGQEGTVGLADNFTNPYTKEILTHKGQNYSIWYYYTERIGEKNWENGVTPVVFLNDKVIGVGWRSMEKLELDSKSSTIRIK